MKKLILIAGLTWVVTSKNVLIAQEKKPKISIIKSDTYSLSADGITSTLEGNVAMTSDKLNIDEADKVVIDKETNKIIVVGYKEFSFKGKLVVVPSLDYSHKTIEYIVGEDVAYIK